jgi:DNA polymerase/3'-5' exonuclease PolX
MFNSDIADALKYLAKKEDHPYKKQAYYSAASTIQSIPTDISSLENYRIIPGVGESISVIIKEFKEKGTVKGERVKLSSSVARTGKSSHRFDREEVAFLISDLLEKAREMNLKFDVCGSYRRGKKDIGDIDILIDIDQMYYWESIATIFEAKIVNKGNVNMDIIYKGIPINFRGVEKDGWGAGLLYLTGSQNFNIFMRSKAKSLSLKLNQNGLYNAAGIKLLSNSEEEIFERLHIKYIAPKDRSF